MTEAEHIDVFEMRQSGATLQQIAARFAVSRERVRQVLVRHYGSSRLQGLLGAAEIARYAGCTQSYIHKLRRRGIIQPAKVVGRGRTLWKPETADTIIAYRESQRCGVCDGALPSNHWVYCSEACRIEGQTHRYRNSPEQGRRLHNERVARWRRNHTEQAREIDRRKQRRYYAKKSSERYQSGQYVVRKQCLIPLGTIVEGLGCGTTKDRLKVQWGGQIVELPFSYVKRVAKQAQKLDN